MSEEDRKKWAYGSQMFLLGLTGYVVILWTLKFNMLCFYSRVVRGLWTERFVKPLMVVVILSVVVIIITLAATCRPFHHLWQTRDVLVGIQTNRLKKFGLILLFSLGFFCMFAAILRFVLIFNASPSYLIPYNSMY
ncbi:hypothetical protein LB505_009294 [Fusarium chuoi]|nr:hypothetical protein LB505_009294 [Fusarium chuoi]